MRKFRIPVLLLMLILTANACVKQQLEAIYNSQEDKIDSYIEEQLEIDSTYTVTYNNGTARLTKLPGSGEELSASGSISFYYAGYTFNGSISNSKLFGTNRTESAQEAGWNLEDADYSLMEINLREADLLEGVRNGLVGVKSGEECEILFSSKYGFGKGRFGIIPDNSALAFKIWVLAVSND